MKDKNRNCDSCEALMINGVYCHETGCPEAWRDYDRECEECGCPYAPEERYQRYCSQHCATLATGLECDCDDCEEQRAADVADLQAIDH